jgi:hypothetical protein
MARPVLDDARSGRNLNLCAVVELEVELAREHDVRVTPV